MHHLHLYLFEKYLKFRSLRFFPVLAVCMLTVLTGLTSFAHAQTPSKPNVWVVTISDDPDPVPSGGTLTYKVSAKNDGPVQSLDVRITIDLPSDIPGVQFVSCKTSYDAGTVKYCLGVINGQVITTLPRVKAHKTVNVTVVVNVPKVDATTQILLKAKAEGESAFKGDATAKTTLLPPETNATLLPSGRGVAILCDSVLDRLFFQTDTIVQLNRTLGCIKSAQFGLKIAQSGVTLALQGKKIIVSGVVAGTAGVVIGAGATNVTVDGGGTDGGNGIENFDWCVRDEGGNTGLVVKNLRCYKARSAALDIVSDNVEVSKLKIDSTTPTLTTTQELPGGIGIHAGGDNIRIKDTIVRRSALIGILADGVDVDLNGYATTIDGNTKSSIVEQNTGLGVVLQNGPHLLKDTAVYGDGPDKGTSTDGVVVDTGIGNRLDGVVVKKFNGNGVVVNASETLIERTGIDKVSQNGFVISALASNVILNGNSSKNLGGAGFVVEGDSNRVTTGKAEKNLGNGFHVSGNGNLVENSNAKSNSGAGFVVEGDSNRITTNKTEKNLGNGFHVSGNGNLVENSNAKSNSGLGFGIAGSSNTCGTNSTERNGGYEWIISVNNIDNGSNSANKKRFSFKAAGGVFE